jgi:hypothetical protein
MSYNNKERNTNEKSLINYLINYLETEKAEDHSSNDVGQRRENITIRIRRSIYDRFNILCHDHGLIKRGHTNIALEGLIFWLIDSRKEQTIVQANLPHFLDKSELQRPTPKAIGKPYEKVEEALGKLRLVLANFEEISKIPNSLEYYLCIAQQFEDLPEAMELKKLSGNLLSKSDFKE